LLGLLHCGRAAAGNRARLPFLFRQSRCARRHLGFRPGQLRAAIRHPGDRPLPLAFQPDQLIAGLRALLPEQLGTAPLHLARPKGLGLLLLQAADLVAAAHERIVALQHPDTDLFQLRDESSLLGGLGGFLRVQRSQFPLDHALLPMQRPMFPHQQADLQRPRFVLQHLIILGLPGLPLQRIQPLLDLRDDVPHPAEVLGRRVHLAQRFGLLLFVADDAGRFFDQFAALQRRGIENLFDSALLDHRMPLGPGDRIHQEAANVF
jgi:hypothetical protein